MRTCIFVYINIRISTCIRICVHTPGKEPIVALNVFVCKFTYTHTHTCIRILIRFKHQTYVCNDGVLKVQCYGCATYVYRSIAHPRQIKLNTPSSDTWVLCFWCLYLYVCILYIQIYVCSNMCLQCSQDTTIVTHCCWVFSLWNVWMLVILCTLQRLI